MRGFTEFFLIKKIFLNSKTHVVPGFMDKEFGICAYFRTVASHGQGLRESSSLSRTMIKF